MNRKSPHKSEHHTEHRRERLSEKERLSLGAKRNISLPLGNLISLVAVAAIAGSAYWNLSSTVSRLERAITAIFTELKVRKEWTYEEPLARLWRVESAVEQLEERIKYLEK